MSKPVIKTKNLTKYFKTPRGLLHAVESVNLTIEEGKTIGVVGESGCGKTTLGRVITRLEEATSGEVYLEGKEILGLKGSAKRNIYHDIQMIFQDPYSSLNPRLSLGDIIADPIETMGERMSKKDLHELVLSLMDTVGLPPRYYNQYPHELDGGRRQRVGLARALALDPKFIVCDEPVSALDVSIQAQILNLLMDLQEEKKLAYMFITHNLFVVKHISHNIMVMYMGQVVELAEKNELFAHPSHPYTKALLAAIPQPDLSSRGKNRELLAGEVSSPIEPKPGCRFSPRCPYASEKCRAGEIPLKEIAPNHYCVCTLFSN
ncbi:ABC transporter ATP-binding protein [Parablautia muri]|uniref:ATP-binding cassette domain-containing protein n=1 Tax=Parablautia muri TaxID=2320879 RepID=A0A9X5BFF5_9FIRM|nr:oligopeptide/dipeptide ABC transporter ATP-binding protein [Parablautia muri]NBJ92808.1 ATP-binding cassette domain-containing protein [Parablautia muri]